MKKFLLSIFCTLSVMFAFASNYDTVYVKPNTEFNYKLIVDTVKHPALKGDNYNKVAWYRGYEKPTYQDKQTIVGELLGNVITLDGEKRIHVDNVENGNTLNGFVFYGYKLDLGTKAIADNLLTKTQAASLTTDTVAFIHVLEELVDTKLSGFKINNRNDLQKLTVNEGDSVEFEITYNNALDVQEYAIVSLSEDKKDTTVIVTSDKPYFKVPLKEMEKTTVYAMVSNEIGKLVKTRWGKDITVRPSFKIESIAVSTVSGSKNSTETFNDTTATNVLVYNHDSVAFIINANVKESNVKYVTNWTLNGNQIVCDTITTSKDGLTLMINEFKKPDLDGTYKCMILSTDGKVLGEATFIVESQFPTGNESIAVNKPSLVVANKTIRSNGYDGVVYVYSITGKLVKTLRIAQSEAVTLDVTNGIYIAKFGKETVKFVVR